MPHDRTDAPRGARKVDPRLAMLLEMPPAARSALLLEERKKLAQARSRITALRARMATLPEDAREELQRELAAAFQGVYAPLTAGLHAANEGPSPSLAEPYVSVFIEAHASREDLAEMGVRVRSQAGDLYTAFAPLSRIPALAASAAVTRVELGRPMRPDLDVAIPHAQIDLLRQAAPNPSGKGVVIGIIDSTLDIYHPNFLDATNQSRVLFLWDQTLTPQGGELPPAAYASGQTAPAYGVEYDKTAIDGQLAAFTPGTAYAKVRHNAGGEFGAHGTAVAGIAAGNGTAASGSGKHYTGAAPVADMIFVAQPNVHNSGILADSTEVVDAFVYVFERAAELGQPCVVNLSNGDNLGPHDGTAFGERFLDALLELPGRAIVLSAGNSTTTGCHATGSVPAGGAKALRLTCQNNAANSDALQIWYDGHDRFDVSVALPGAAPVNVAAGSSSGDVPVAGITLRVTSEAGVSANGDNVIDILLIVPAGGHLPNGDIVITLTGTTVINGKFHAWVDRNNRLPAPNVFFATDVDEKSLTLGTPGTARRPITVGNHDRAADPLIAPTSGLGPTRDGRIKPEIAATGVSVRTTLSQNRNAPGAENYGRFDGTSASAPLVAGACACLFECRGPNTTWSHLKQILAETAAAPSTATIPDNGFGFGYVQVATGCSLPAPACDVWIRDDAADTGQEPFTGGIVWLSPDIQVLDTNGNAVANPSYANGALNNIIRVTVRNRGANAALNTEVYLYWADPATNIPYPSQWMTTGFFTPSNGAFTIPSNRIVIPQLAAGASTTVDFGWAPPAPGSNIRGDDHFCLLVRLENQADPSMIGAGTFAIVGTRNNIALRNLHVQTVAESQAMPLNFWMVGTEEEDSLLITPLLLGGKAKVILPVQSLPWRDRARTERFGGRRQPYNGRGRDERGLPEGRFDAAATRRLTGIEHAKGMEVAHGLAAIELGMDAPLRIPEVRLQAGVRMPVRVALADVRVGGDRRFVHVTQRSGGQVVGGVSLQLR